MDGRTDGISPHSTGLCPLWGPLPKNQLPKGIMRSLVPLPCLFDIVKSQKLAGQEPRQGTKFCRMGKNSVPMSICPSIRHPSKGTEDQLEGSEGQPAGSEGQQEGGRRTCRWTDGRNFYLFYRTLSPVRANALLPSETPQHERSRAKEPLTS